MISDNSNNSDTIEWLKTLKKDIENLHIVHASQAPEKFITVSMGIYSTKIHQTKNVDTLYAEADKALYEAKSLGRNGVVVA